MRFLVLDTESSLCVARRRRLLVSLAYEVVEVGTASGEEEEEEEEGQPRPPRHRILAAGYDVIRQPDDTLPDARSVRIHGITPQYSWSHGEPLRQVLDRFFRCLEAHRPDAVVGHDIVGDVSLLATEELLLLRGSPAVPASPHPAVASRLHRLVCTRMLSTHRCAIPLPRHLRQPGLHDGLLAGRRPRPGVTHKWPSLQESYDLLVRDPDGAPPSFAKHDARGDVERCRAIFLSLLSACLPVSAG